MKGVALRTVLACMLAGVLWSGMAVGDLSVSVTITGPLDEMVPLLQHLKDLGVGAPHGSAPKIEIQSVGTPVTPAPPEPPPKPPLALSDAKSDPAIGKPGANMLLQVAVSDPDHVVDTLAATVEGVPSAVEMYDNGSHGDAAAGDGVWTGTLTLAPEVTPGDHAVEIKAFGANGTPVMKKDEAGAEAPLACPFKITVQP